MSRKEMMDESNFIAAADTCMIGNSMPHRITFHCEDGEWVIRITKEGVESNPNVSVDAGAKAIFDALEPYLRSL